GHGHLVPILAHPPLDVELVRRLVRLHRRPKLPRLALPVQREEVHPRDIDDRLARLQQPEIELNDVPLLVLDRPPRPPAGPRIDLPPATHPGPEPPVSHLRRIRV